MTRLSFKVVSVVCFIFLCCNARAQNVFFFYTGDSQTWVVPAGVNVVHLQVEGGKGGDDPGGAGGRVFCDLAVSPGETLYINVGSMGNTDGFGVGGFNGGGNGNAAFGGAGGGGATDIRIGGTTLANRVVVAGGGGGSYDNGISGVGGGLTGGDADVAEGGGGGGTQTEGGTAGSYNSTSGQLGFGGVGADISNTGGGGGGGGYYGGGGGGNGGGGGGSSYTNPLVASNVVLEQGTVYSHGSVGIWYNLPTEAYINGSTTLCKGSSANILFFSPSANATITYNINGGTDQTITLDENGSATMTVSPDTSSTYTLTYISDGTNGSVITGQSATVIVNPLPFATMSANSYICFDSSTELSFEGTPGAIVSVYPGNITDTLNVYGFGGVLITPGENTTIYTLVSVFNDTTGCSQLLSMSDTIVVGAQITGGYIVGPMLIYTGTTITLTDSAGTLGGNWTSFDPNVATVSGTGMVTGISPGTDTIFYSVTNACGSGQAILVITVEDAATAGYIIGPSTTCMGSQITLTDSAGTTGGVWSSVNIDIATIDGSGLVTGIAPGIDTIQYTVGGLVAQTVIAIHAPPTVNLGNDTTICDGSTLILDAGVSGDFYLYNDGSTGEFLSITENGQYSVIVSAVTGCSAVDTINVSINPLPSVNLGNDTMICAGAVLMLNAGNATVNTIYMYSDGSNGQFLAVDTAGQYYVLVTSPIGCMATDTINVAVNPVPVVNLGNDTSICVGTSLTLDAGVPNAIFTWSDGSMAQMLNVVAAGQYYVIATTNGCMGADTINVSVTALPTVDDILLTNISDFEYVFTAVNAQNATNIAWDFGDGGTAMGSPVTHTFGQGTFPVRVIVSNNCGSDTAYTSVITEGVRQVNIREEELSTYPNPAKDEVTIENKSALNLVSISVINTVGQVVYVDEVGNAKIYRLSTATLGTGIYTIRIQTDKGNVVRKLQVIK